MARSLGARARLALGFETTYGTPPASGFIRMPFAPGLTVAAEQPLLDSELLGYGRDPLAPVKDAITADGDVVVPIDAEAWGHWLKAAFGAPTTSGTGPYTHEFQSGAWDLPSFALEKGLPEVPHFAMYPGCRVNQLQWSMERSGLVTATVGVIAQGEDKSARARPARRPSPRSSASAASTAASSATARRSATWSRPRSPTPTISTGWRRSAPTARSTAWSPASPR